MSVERFISVTDLTRTIKRTIEDHTGLQNVWMRGEISNFKHHSRGHMYFTVKDEQSRIQTVMFAGHNRHLTFKPENGMKVLIRGDVSVYEPYGQYQFYAKEMQPDGIGNLYLAYEKMKEKLASEGLFLEQFKQPIPTYPMKVGVITSPTGAAIKDIVTTLKRRFPVASITLLPVLVQGAQAARSIERAIVQANEISTLDLLIVGRGGGSIEELWAFNEEVVARAIFDSNLPVISAVGHETDFTIADFVADLRAPTPTAAAELAVPDLKELKQTLSVTKNRLTRAMKEQTSREQARLRHLQKSYAFRYPGQLFHQKEQELDRLLERLSREASQRVEKAKVKLDQVDRSLAHHHPSSLVVQAKEKRKQLEMSLMRTMNEQVKDKQNDFQQVLSKLQILNPLNVMERGYSLAYTEQKALVKSIEQMQPGEQIDVQVVDGSLQCEVKDIQKQKSPSDGEGML